jgi:hypothetical protein
MLENSSRSSLDDLVRQLVDAVPPSIKAMGDDLERNFRSLLQVGLAKMDLVTREEFDLQVAVLKRTREKLEALDAKLAELERSRSS